MRQAPYACLCVRVRACMCVCACVCCVRRALLPAAMCCVRALTCVYGMPADVASDKADGTEKGMQTPPRLKKQFTELMQVGEGALVAGTSAYPKSFLRQMQKWGYMAKVGLYGAVFEYF